MKRFGLSAATIVLASVFAGCDGGVQEGMPKDAATANPQPDGFRAQMEKQGKDMTNQKKRPAGTPAKPVAPPAGDAAPK